MKSNVYISYVSFRQSLDDFDEWSLPMLFMTSDSIVKNREANAFHCSITTDALILLVTTVFNMQSLTCNLVKGSLFPPFFHHDVNEELNERENLAKESRKRNKRLFSFFILLF